MDQVDVLVVGAGVVGLAAARALAMRGRDVLVAEAAPRYGSGVSSRSSEVVHAGLYYEPGSLKARLCVRGRELLYAYCRERGVAHARCGKLVVATRQQDEGRLEAIRTRLSARHAPNEVFVIPEVPRTISGKKMEVPVKRILLGHPVARVANRDAMANPGSIDWFVDFARARGTAAADLAAATVATATATAGVGLPGASS